MVFALEACIRLLDDWLETITSLAVKSSAKTWYSKEAMLQSRFQYGGPGQKYGDYGLRR